MLNNEGILMQAYKFSLICNSSYSGEEKRKRSNIHDKATFKKTIIFKKFNYEVDESMCPAVNQEALLKDGDRLLEMLLSVPS